MGGPRRKTEKFRQIEKKIGDLYELDNFKQKIFFGKKFKIEIANVIFRPNFNESKNIFDRSRKSNADLIPQGYH